MFLKFSSQNSIDLDVFTQCEALLSKSAESIVETVMRRDPHEVEYVQAVQEFVHPQ